MEVPIASYNSIDAKIAKTMYATKTSIKVTRRTHDVLATIVGYGDGPLKVRT